jgi:hypothetical protein
MPTNLIPIVRAPDSADLLKAYFAETGTTYTGRRFDRLGGGGDRGDIRDVITATDLVAVEMPGVQVPPEVSINILEGPLGRELSDLLKQVPTSVDLGEGRAAEEVEDDSPANLAWRRLKEQKGVGAVIAGKILARKRPRLLPVWDQVLWCQFGRPEAVWKQLQNALSADDGILRKELGGLRDRAALPAEISLIRVLDVVLWMRHRPEHKERNCPGYDTVTFV